MFLNPTNFDFEGIEQVRLFNANYLREGTESNTYFLRDCKEILSIINSTIPTSDQAISGKRLVSRELMQFTEIAKRSFNELHLAENEAKEIIQLMNKCNDKLSQSQLLDKHDIVRGLNETRSEILTHGNFQQNEAKIGKIDITNQIKTEQQALSKCKKNAEWFEKVIPAVIAVPLLGAAGTVVGGILGLTLGGLVGIPLLVVGLVTLFAGIALALFHGQSGKANASEMNRINLRIDNLVRFVREAAKEPGFQEFIKKKQGVIEDLDDWRLGQVMNSLREWNELKKRIQSLDNKDLIMQEIDKNPELMPYVKDKIRNEILDSP